ncbi:DUF4124 domain-containing protein [Aquabacterium sp.]|uniref:DUF4124 domain-containing protein n=1 Tax=Aquabacterium sp. TaxID=1872578 RepID=UPI0035C6BE00
MSQSPVADRSRSRRLQRQLSRMGRAAAAPARLGVALALSSCLASLLVAGAARAAGIYTCVDANGKRHTSDRPIAECLDREQRMLNKDGSQKQTVPPRLNAEERALAEERQRLQEQAQAAQKDAVRRDRNLMLRFPDEAAHNKAREAALDDLRRGVVGSERRLQELLDERKPLLAETEFYKGKRLPHKLKARLEANDAQQQAQRDIIQNQNAETVRINALYDAELARLKRLWAGAAPGSVPVAAPAEPSSRR